MKRLLTLTLCAAALLGGCADRSLAGPAPLAIERTIPLTNVSGRIDHLALDLKHHRLFVAEIANGTVDIVSLDSNAAAGRITGLSEPQGLAYLPESDELVVASGGEGSIRFYDASSLALKQKIDGFDDADNVRIDPSNGHVVVGFGSGGLAIVDPKSHTVVGKVALRSHPEGFQITPDGKTAFVNLPRALSVAVVDMRQGGQVSAWSTGAALENFPMALDGPGNGVAVGFRMPGRFVMFDGQSGVVKANLGGCGQTDDLFYDLKRGRYYMLCGSGSIDVFGNQNGQIARIDQVVTSSGGRTGLFSPEEDRLYVAVSASSQTPAHVLVMAPR